MSETIMYKTKDGCVELDVQLSGETVWLSQKQMAVLFDKNIRTISEHIGNVFKDDELKEDTVVQHFQTTAEHGKSYDTKYYNLDVIISVGYRVCARRATEFRQWATEQLKHYLMKGYMRSNPGNDTGTEAMHLIMGYAKTWHLLLAYDEDRLHLPEQEQCSVVQLDYKTALIAIDAFKSDLIAKGDATAFFGNERDNALERILANIEQTFDGEALYKSREERAAHLLYFIVKDHPFSDGNKRIGCFVFLLYLRMQRIDITIDDKGLAALALLLAESEPQQKALMIRLIVNMVL